MRMSEVRIPFAIGVFGEELPGRDKRLARGPTSRMQRCGLQMADPNNL